MRYHTTTLISRLRLFACLLLASFFTFGPLAPTADAIFRGCRSDPVVILSDGTVLDVQAEIGTNVSNVREIHYVVHGPPGVQLVASISTPMLGFTGLETFTYVADAKPGQYITDTIVHTHAGRVPVTSHTTFAKTNLLWDPFVWLQYTPVKGYSGDVLRLVLTR